MAGAAGIRTESPWLRLGSSGPPAGCQHQMTVLLVQLPPSRLLRPELFRPTRGPGELGCYLSPLATNVGSSSCQEVKAGPFLFHHALVSS